MASRLLQRLRADVGDHRLLEAGDTVLAAVSGGADSVALLCLLGDLAGELDLEIRAAHCNHGLRDAESDADESFVRELCRQREVPLVVERLRIDPAQGNLEERLRDLRYRFLVRTAAGNGAVVATGHTRDDRAETLLLHLFRGSGPAGLASIPWRRRAGRDVAVVRPLLGCSRAELIEELRHRDQLWREDSSNADLALDRNWMRHRLIPEIRQRFNPSLSATLAGTADVMAEIDRWTDQQVADLLQGNEQPTRLPLQLLSAAPRALARAAVRHLVKANRGNLRNVTLGHVDDVLQLGQRQTGRRVQLPGLWVEREFDSLVFYPVEPEVEPFSTPLQVPGTTLLPGIGKRIQARIRTTVDDDPEGASALLKPAAGPLTARSRRPGDRYRMPGRPSKSVKRLLSESRIPRRQRDRLVLVTCDEAVVWIEGFPPHADFSTDSAPALQLILSEETADS